MGGIFSHHRREGGRPGSPHPNKDIDHPDGPVRGSKGCSEPRRELTPSVPYLENGARGGGGLGNPPQNREDEAHSTSGSRLQPGPPYIRLQMKPPPPGSQAPAPDLLRVCPPPYRPQCSTTRLPRCLKPQPAPQNRLAPPIWRPSFLRCQSSLWVRPTSAHSGHCSSDSSLKVPARLEEDYSTQKAALLSMAIGAFWTEGWCHCKNPTAFIVLRSIHPPAAAGLVIAARSSWAKSSSGIRAGTDSSPWT